MDKRAMPKSWHIVHKPSDTAHPYRVVCTDGAIEFFARTREEAEFVKAEYKQGKRK